MGQPWGGGYGSYGPPPGGYGYGGYGPPGGYDPDPRAKSVAIAALVCNILGFFCCWPVAIGGLICSIIAITKADTQGSTARTLNMWAWILCAVEFVVGIGFIVFYVIAYVSDAGSTY